MKRKDIKQSIKEYFFINPSARLRVREIERALKFPLPSVIRYCKELEKERILVIIRTGSVSFFTANSNEKYFLEKKLCNIKMLYNCGIIEYLKLELSNPPVIIFGSYSQGEDTEDSDIDLYIETPSNKQVNLDKYNKRGWNYCFLDGLILSLIFPVIF